MGLAFGISWGLARRARAVIVALAVLTAMVVPLSGAAPGARNPLVAVIVRGAPGAVDRKWRVLH